MRAILPNLRVADVAASVAFYQRVLGFEPAMSLPAPDGSLVHAAVTRGDVTIMFGPLNSPWGSMDGDGLGKGVTLYAEVGPEEDIDALFDRARAEGAAVVQEPTDQFWGSRDWGIADPDGYQIFVAKTTRSMTADEMAEAMMAGSPA
jgi:PhnB protein